MQPHKDHFVAMDASFPEVLMTMTASAKSFAEVLRLCTLRKKALAKGFWKKPSKVVRVAFVGGASLRPLVDLIEHFAAVGGHIHCDFWVGDFDNYHAEILNLDSGLYGFKPDVVMILPSERRCVFGGSLANSRVEVEVEGRRQANELIGLCRAVREGAEAEVIVGNYRLPPSFDPGPMRSHLGSDYSFRKFVNGEIAALLPAYGHTCDIEFLSNRLGNLLGVDERMWFESKQPFAATLLMEVAREFAFVVSRLGAPSKKVAVLDLDNTLWGGVIGDDGLEGIEIGTTSPRGEAFKAFQSYLLELSGRGILLAACSKNDHGKAIEPFEMHPEMVLRLKDFASFKANWSPKSDNMRQIASDLNVGLDSLVFIDDNPAEINIVQQFVPEVATVWVGEDPSSFVQTLKDSRHFEMRTLTHEDVIRGEQYKREAERQVLLENTTDMDAYLRSLEMVAVVEPFTMLNSPRIAQLIAKSNQFNLTTRRRSEAETQDLVNDSGHPAFTVRLSDRFGDHGLIAIVIGALNGKTLQIDTWLMSCRVLKRQVENEVLNEIVRLAKLNECELILGRYIPSHKNSMVKELYPSLGFQVTAGAVGEVQEYELVVDSYSSTGTNIKVVREICGSRTSNS